jgi:YidC/Oxa1 family membrane protein insertase
LAEYQNPQNEPGNERRLLLVFLATFAVMLVLQPLFKKYFPQPPASQPAAQTTLQRANTQSQSTSSVVGSSAPIAAPPQATKQASTESETVIENNLYRIAFTNQGAQVKSWILKKFNNDAQNGPLDLVNPAAAAQFGYPLSLWTYDEALRHKLSSALYVASTQGLQAAPATVSFEYSDQDIAVRKTFRFDDSYIVNVETSVTSKGVPVAAFPAWPSGFGDQTTLAFYAATFVDYQFNKNIVRLPTRCGFSIISRCSQVVGGATIPGPFHWAGPTDQYFAAVFIPEDPASATTVTLHNQIAIPRDPSRPESKETVQADVLGAAVGNLHGPTAERIFVGPKELEVLQRISVPGVSGADSDLNGLIDFGTFGSIAKILFAWLRWTYHHIVSNWGWAIILQTLMITALLMPLRVFQIHSMYKMQKIQPQMKAIQEKYKKYSMRDPRKQEMQKEIYALQQKEGANPVAGCLPMLVQLPFLWAYYGMLRTALDLRHAHWFWIHDLSAADPIFILPILLVLSSLLTQRMTPQAGMDPSQQRMMNVMMPVMMGFIFFRLAAGVNLYYVVVNLIGIAQQSVMNRTKLGREMRELMEKRARKREK